MSELKYHADKTAKLVDSIEERVENAEARAIKAEKRADAMSKLFTVFTTTEEIERHIKALEMGLPMFSRLEVMDTFVRGLKPTDEYKKFSEWLKRSY